MIHLSTQLSTDLGLLALPPQRQLLAATLIIFVVREEFLLRLSNFMIIFEDKLNTGTSINHKLPKTQAKPIRLSYF